jgi:hypothetical protein
MFDGKNPYLCPTVVGSDTHFDALKYGENTMFVNSLKSHVVGSNHDVLW